MERKWFLMNNYIFLSVLFIVFSCESNKRGSSSSENIYGCTDNKAINFNFNATTDDGGCEYLGCTESGSANFDSLATIDDGNCIDGDQVPLGHVIYWNDEFNSDSLDERFWNVELMDPGANNNESQAYTNSKENIFLHNGYLYLRAKKDNPFNPNEPGYTSGRINTKNKVDLQYGLWEIRAKLPSGTGTWPAIWMLGSNIDAVGWPNCGEIDIMEHVGHYPDKVFFSLHNASLFGNVSNTNQQGIYHLDGIENDFHRFSLDWGPDYIRGYVDNNLYFSLEKPASNNYNLWPYDNNFFLVLNLAIGGDWGGQQGINNSMLPASFIIDYVRVFQKVE